jgi:uncharacterized membrane protein HdeD (DUF308 family)
MLDLFARNWWVYVIRGAVALIFGMYAWFMPGLAMKILLTFFGIFVLIEGIFAIIGSIAGRKHSDVWWIVLLEGIAGLALGILTLTRPLYVATVIVIFVAIWAIWGGLFRIIAAVRLRREIESEWLLILGGIVSILFGLMLFKYTGAGIVAISWMIAFFATFFGVLLISFGFKVRKFQKEAEAGQAL